MSYLDETGVRAVITEVKNRLAVKVTQFSSMPVASSTYSGMIVQYTGSTFSSYTQGDFYRCNYNTSVNPAVYQWDKISYNKNEIDNLISTAGHFEIVESLPTTNIRTNVIYLVPKTISVVGYLDSVNSLFYVSTGTSTTPSYDKYDNNGDFVESVTGSNAISVSTAIAGGTYTETTRDVKARELNNVKTEYINLDGTSAGWEKIGDTTIDLSDYVKIKELTPVSSAELASMWGNS